MNLRNVEFRLVYPLHLNIKIYSTQNLNPVQVDEWNIHTEYLHHSKVLDKFSFEHALMNLHDHIWPKEVIQMDEKCEN